MTRSELSGSEAPPLHVARAKYLTAYALLSFATGQLATLTITRGAYKRTRRGIVRAVAIVVLVGGMLGLATPRTSEAIPVFAEPVPNAFGTQYWNWPGNNDPALVDIDGDGDLDLFLGTFEYVNGDSKYVTTALFTNVGTPSAPAFIFSGNNVLGITSTYNPTEIYGEMFCGGPAFVDIDGDGDMDNIIQTAAYGLSYFRNNGTATAPAFGNTALPPGLPNGINGANTAFVDIDGDGDFDVFIGRGGPYSQIRFQENTGTATAPNFASAVYSPFGLVTPGYAPAPVFFDFDGDGDHDALFGTYAGDIIAQTNVGTPSAPAFTSPVTNPFGFEPAVLNPRSKLAPGDLDDDGDIDLMVGTEANSAAGINYYENLEINCGDGIIDPSETCDGVALGGETCESQGYDGGTLGCGTDCVSFDVSACAGLFCAPTPSGTCLAPGKAQIQIKNTGDPTKGSLKFKWQKGVAAVAQVDLGNPITTHDSALCIYDETGGVPSLVGRVGVPANAFWQDKDPKGYQLVDKTGTHDGVTKVQLKTGDAGKPSVSLQAKGANLTLPTPISGTEYFSQDTDVTVQLVSEAGICWSANFAVTGTTKNDGVQFKAK
jgi:hypothetical protein